MTLLERMRLAGFPGQPEAPQEGSKARTECRSPAPVHNATAPIRCWRCRPCRRILVRGHVSRMLVEASIHASTYLWTLTVPAGTSDADLRALWRKRVNALRMRCRRSGVEIAWAKFSEAHKSGTGHLHVLFHATGDAFDAVWLREAWPHLSDIRLVAGQGRDLDAHVTKRNAFRWSDARRRAYDPKIPVSEKRAGTGDAKSPAAVAYYAAKYAAKGAAADAAPAARRNRGCDFSRGYGLRHRLIASFGRISDAAAHHMVEWADDLGPAEWHDLQWKCRNHWLFSGHVVTAFAVLKGLETKPRAVASFFDDNALIPIRRTIDEWRDV